MLFSHKEPPIMSCRYDLITLLAESLVSRCQSIIRQSCSGGGGLMGVCRCSLPYLLLCIKYPGSQKPACQRTRHLSGDVIANYQTVPENWVLIQRKIGYPASPSKTNLETGMSYCSVMIELMLMESVIINQIWWE